MSYYLFNFIFTFCLAFSSSTSVVMQRVCAAAGNFLNDTEFLYLLWWMKSYHEEVENFNNLLQNCTCKHLCECSQHKRTAEIALLP
jgi:hypothetical protein